MQDMVVLQHNKNLTCLEQDQNQAINTNPHHKANLKDLHINNNLNLIPGLLKVVRDLVEDENAA